MTGQAKAVFDILTIDRLDVRAALPISKLRASLKSLKGNFPWIAFFHNVVKNEPNGRRDSVMSGPSISANEAYSLCFWVDNGATIGPPSPWQSVWQSSMPGAGFAAVVQNSNQPTSYAVVIQGTKNLMDAIFDMQVEKQVPYPYVSGCNIAVGANNDLNQVLNNLGSSGVTLSNFLQNTVIKSSNQILITGHSLGGATTALLAPWIAYVLNNQQPITALPSNVTAITFAAPAIGDTNFANFLNGQSNYAANCNVNDAVPHA